MHCGCSDGAKNGPSTSGSSLGSATRNTSASSASPGPASTSEAATSSSSASSSNTGASSSSTTTTADGSSKLSKSMQAPIEAAQAEAAAAQAKAQAQVGNPSVLSMAVHNCVQLNQLRVLLVPEHLRISTDSPVKFYDCMHLQSVHHKAKTLSASLLLISKCAIA